MRLKLNIRGCRGYGAEQVKGITVRDLKDLLELYDDNDEIVLYDTCNRYGPKYGSIMYSLDYAEGEDYE